LDDAYSFVLTDAVIIKQNKTDLVVQTAEPISTGSATQNTTVVAKPINSTVQKEIVIIANDTIKVK
jgi:hypothetical protein